MMSQVVDLARGTYCFSCTGLYMTFSARKCCQPPHFMHERHGLCFSFREATPALSLALIHSLLWSRKKQSISVTTTRMRFGNQALAFFFLHLAAAKGEVYTYNYNGARKQTFTAPKSGRFRITAVGARGGDCAAGCDQSTCKYCKGEKDPDVGCPRILKYDNDPNNPAWCYTCDAQYHKGGYGARAEGTFYLRKGDKIEIIVGGMGQNCQSMRQVLDTDIYGTTTPDGRDYLEALTGAGGGGASSVRVEYADGQQQVLLAAGGGGGAAKFFNGEDGQVGPNGGWDWGGRYGGGGGLGPSQLPQFGGAGGGGVSGDGASVNARYVKAYLPDSLDTYALNDGEKSDYRYNEYNRVWAEGGFSLSNGSQGGYAYRTEYSIDNENYQYEVTARSGSAGGYGSGGQGGSGE